MFSKKDYKIYKSAFKSQKLKLTTSDWAKKNVQCLAKNKLLSIIHLGLLMIGSEIQLSDLLR